MKTVMVCKRNWFEDGGHVAWLNLGDGGYRLVKLTSVPEGRMGEKPAYKCAICESVECGGACEWREMERESRAQEYNEAMLYSGGVYYDPADPEDL